MFFKHPHGILVTGASCSIRELTQQAVSLIAQQLRVFLDDAPGFRPRPGLYG